MNTTHERKILSLKKNDQVQVIAGRDKGKIGKILSVNSKSGRVTVEKINMIKRHMKPTQQSPQGGILEKESAIHYSNVQIMCPKCNRGVRHGVKFVGAAAKGAKKAKAAGAEETKQIKVRVCKKCGETLDQAKA